MAEGTQVGSIYYSTTLDTQGLIDGRRRAEAELKKAGDAGDQLQARFSKIGAAIGAALAAIGVKRLVDEMVKVQRETDVLTSALETAAGGAEAAGREFERLKRFAAETPYSLKQSVDGFVKLVNMGLDPSERAMRSFGNTASAMGKDLMQMVEAVADASTGQFERLLEFGIKSKDEGSKVALTFRGVKTEVAKNAQAITEYLIKLGETNFATAMSARMVKLDGDISNLADTWTSLVRTVSQAGAGEAIAKGVRMAAEAIAQAEASIKRGQLTEYFDALRPVLMGVEVAAVSLAGSLAGKLVTAATASTTAFVTKTLAARAAAAQAVVTAEAELAAAVAAEREAVAQYGLTGSLAAVTAASARTAAAQEAMAVAQANAARQATVGSLAGGVFRGVIGALGGPIGIAITALTLLALNWDKVGLQAKSAAQIAEDSAQRIRAALSRTGGTPMAALQQQLEDAKKGMADMDALIAKAEKASSGKGEKKENEGGGGGFGTQVGPDTSGLLARREAYRQSIVDTTKAIEDLKKQQVEDLFPPEGPKAPKVKQEPDKSVLAKAQEAKAYYEQMVAANAQGLAKINAEEQQALADNKKRQIEDKDNAAVYQKARTEIVARFARERALLEESNTRAAAEAQIATITDTEAQIIAIRDETLRQANREVALGVKTFQEGEAAKTKAIYDAMEQQKQLRLQRQQTQINTLQIRAETTGNPQDQAALIAAQAQAQVDAANEAAQRDLANWQMYADQKVAIYQRMQMQLLELQTATDTAQYAMAQSAAGQMLDVLRRAGKERTALGKALFLAERALAVAMIIMNTELGAAKAVGIAGPFGIPLATLIRATGYASAGMVAGLAVADAFGGGRQYGGPVDAGSMYRVNETGRPEMFTASNGAQYMLPTSGGRVTSAADVAGGSAPTIIIQNMGQPMAVQSQSWDPQTRTAIVKTAVQEVAGQIAERRGEVWGALRTTSVQGRPG
jgi:hypothetical protein